MSEIARLSAIVESLLALARADAGTTPAETIDVPEVARERLEAWRAAARERDVELSFVADEPASAHASADRVRQVLDNLIANALDVAPSGSTVTVTVDPAGPELVVRDEGPGLSDEEKRRAFDRFWRGRATGTGSGLGLAIARRLVEADGGTIVLRDGPDGGLEAVVQLRPAAGSQSSGRRRLI